MHTFIEFLETALVDIVEVGAIALELVGIVVMVSAAAKGFLRWIRREEDGPQLEEGILTALEFMMCAEVLKTVTAHNMDDYIALGAIIILRFALAFEVQWELRNKAFHEQHARAASKPQNDTEKK